MKKEPLEAVRGSGNVYRDFGVADADVKQLEAILAAEIIKAARALRQNKIFHQLLQALIELAAQGSEERSLLEKISNHVAARGVAPQEELGL